MKFINMGFLHDFLLFAMQNYRQDCVKKFVDVNLARASIGATFLNSQKLSLSLGDVLSGAIQKCKIFFDRGISRIAYPLEVDGDSSVGNAVLIRPLVAYSLRKMKPFVDPPPCDWQIPQTTADIPSSIRISEARKVVL